MVDIKSTAEFILRVQRPDGEIPWSPGGKTDHWDHVESAMGLAIGGFQRAARKAYLWSQQTQLDDGSWWSYYQDGQPIRAAYKDTNMSAYIAVGVLHYYLVTADKEFLLHTWPMVQGALDFVIDLQGEGGQMYWAKEANGNIEKRALLTGSSSIYLSLRCALRIASLLGYKKPHWEKAKLHLGHAIKSEPELFDQSKARFSMDWYYPILCGAVTGADAVKRIESLWSTFTIPGWGVKCVSDQPWTTMAETAELVLALAGMGKYDIAEQVYIWLHDKKYDDGSFWTGVTFPDRVIYTEEKTAWTGAAVLLASDILFSLTPACSLFAHDFWEASAESQMIIYSDG